MKFGENFDTIVGGRKTIESETPRCYINGKLVNGITRMFNEFTYSCPHRHIHNLRMEWCFEDTCVINTCDNCLNDYSNSFVGEIPEDLEDIINIVPMP